MERPPLRATYTTEITIYHAETVKILESIGDLCQLYHKIYAMSWFIRCSGANELTRLRQLTSGRFAAYTCALPCSMRGDTMHVVSWSL